MYSLAGSMCEENVFKRMGYKLLSLYPKDEVKRAFERHATRYDSIETVGARCLYDVGFFVYDKKMFDTYEDMEFEGRQLMVMGGWEYYLRNGFGFHYMRKPPAEKRHGNAPVSKLRLCKPIL